MPSNNNDEADNSPQGGVSYRGGFSTSIYDGLFEEHGHSDCCVLTCCGILLYDRNYYLLTDKKPSWRGRCCIGTCFCLLVLLTLVASMVAVYLYAYEMERLKELQAEGSRPTQEDATRIDEVKTLVNLSQVCRILVWALAIYLLCKAAQYRYRARRFLMAKLYEERAQTNGNTEVEIGNATAETPLVPPSTSEGLTRYLQAENCNLCCSTAPLGCIAKDAIVDPAALPPPAAEDDNSSRNATDLCYCLWKTLSCLCCGSCCRCWCQCLGLCAIAQEDRELQRMLPKAKFQVDYITFQPFSEYFPKLQALRQTKNNNILTHFCELSQLSHHLCQTLIIALTFLTVLAFTRYDPLFQPAHLLVVYMTFLQAFVIIFLVHWMWNRFDLSFDAIVKYFASGFILCTANAFVYETFVSTTLSLVMGVVRTLMNPPTEEGLGAAADDDDDGVDSPATPIWLLCLAAFLNAFAVAGMVEEISKYFGYWMVEHPDLSLPEDGGPVEGAATANEGSATNTTQQRTMKSLGAGVTVAMVTTAVGFACCENFMYVFVYSRTADAANQMVTLVARSIFPVHPLAAAIQSIGVVKRDVEKDSSMKFGRILLPALLLHGFFDFALMFLDLLGSNSDSDDEEGAKFKGQPGSSLDKPTPSALGGAMPAVVCSVTIVLLAVVYYVVQALAQRKRLGELDKRREGRGEYRPLL